MVRKIKVKLASSFYFYRNYKKIRTLFHRADELESREGLCIVPCDPEWVIGSRGDEAMIVASIQEFRIKYPNEKITIILQKGPGENKIKEAQLDTNIHICTCWEGLYPIEGIYSFIKNEKPRRVVVIGADCIDGAYAPILSLTLISIFGILKKSKIETFLTGFSYNKKPNKLVNWAIRNLPGQIYSVRDINSLQRFENKTNQKGILVADAAFLLKPDLSLEEYKEIVKWIEVSQKSNKMVIAFNFHPMLRSYKSIDEITQDANAVAKNLAEIIKNDSSINFILVPHDDRDRINDGVVLDIINKRLTEMGYNERIRYIKKTPRATQLKALVGLTDGLISSRMHLAIAALGSGVPVMVASYQDKFEGLFKHFGLDSSFILSPSRFCSKEFIEKTHQFIKEITTLKSIVRKELPSIIEKSKINF